MRTRLRFIAIIATLFVLFGLVPPGLQSRALAAGSPFPITETFTNSTAPNWVLGGSAVLTGGGVDPAGGGWLRLTSNATNEAGYAYYNQAFPSTLGIVVEFDYASWGGTGADGTSFFLMDGANTSVNVGAMGGGLGYTQSTAVSKTGVPNGYVGIGLDEWGNYFAPTDGRIDGPGITPNAVGIRGPGNGLSGYNLVAGPYKTTLFEGARNAGVHVRMYITPDKRITVQIKTATLPYTTVINQAQLAAAPPPTFMLGFAASTGGSTNYHELRSLNVAIPSSLDTAVTASSGGQPLTPNQTVAPGQTITYTVTATNSGQNDVTGATTNFTTVSGLTGVSWTCTGSAGGSCGANSGTGLSPTEDLPVGGSVTYTVTGQVANPPTGPVTLGATTQAPVGYTNVSTVSSTSFNVNLAPVAQNQSVTFAANTPKTFALLVSDPDGDALNATAVSPPAHGTVGFTGLSATYTPTAGYTGTDSFSYKVTDTAGAASNPVTVSLATPNPNLSNLSISSGTLSPAFNSGTTSYTATVPGGVTSLTLTPTLVDPAATVKVNGTAVTNGSASGSIPLAVGNNTITVVTTAQDGITTNTYTINVTRSAPTVSIASPAGGTNVATGTPTVSGTADLGTTVQIKVDGQPAGTATPNGSGAWSFTPSPALADGTHTVQAIAVAGDGATSTASQVQFVTDTTAPTVTATLSGQPNANGWYNGPVTATFACQDATSGIAFCPAPVTLSTEGANQSISGTATDKAGNSKTVTVSGINIDTTAPTIAAAPDRQPNANGWYSGQVTITFTCHDAGSGVANCPAPVTLSTEGANQSASGTATDKAGNSKSVTLSGINIDNTAPSIGAAADRQPNANGWYTAPVTVTFPCNDALSGIATCSGATTLASDGANQSVSGFATDKAGNSRSATLSGISIDTTAPTVTATPDRQPNANGWYGAPVTVTFTCADAASGVATCPTPVTLSTEGANQSASGTATDKAGNSKTVTSSGINIDSTAPTISAAPDRQPNANGWYNAPVAVTFTCADATSGVANCPAPVTVSADGANQSASGTATDKAGNSKDATLSGINVDTTPPTGTLQIGDGSGLSKSPNVTLFVSAQDKLSGVAMVRYSTDGTNWSAWEPYASQRAYSLQDDGQHTIYAQFQDRAGNVSAPVTSSVYVDAGKPDASIKIVGVTGDKDHPVLLVSMSVASDPKNPNRANQVAFNGDTVGSAAQPVAPLMQVPLTPGDGLKTVSVVYGDDKVRHVLAILHVLLSYHSSGGTCCYNFTFPAGQGPVGTYYYDPGVQRLVRIATIYDPASGIGHAVARHVSPGFWLTMPEPVQSFSDIADSFAKNEILALAQMNIAHGYADGTFRPHNDVTRAEAATLIVLAAQIWDNGQHDFPDTASHWAKSIIERASVGGVANGYPDGNFRPDRFITRAEFVKMLAAPFNLPLPAANSGAHFNDLNGHWAQRIVEGAAAAGIVSTGSASFRPNDRITREEAVLMLFRAVNYLYAQLEKTCPTAAN